MKCSSACSTQFRNFIRASIYQHWTTAVVQPTRVPSAKTLQTRCIQDKKFHPRAYSTESGSHSRPLESTQLSSSKDASRGSNLERSKGRDSIGKDRKQRKLKDERLSTGKTPTRPYSRRNTKDERGPSIHRVQSSTYEREPWQIQKAALKNKFEDEPWQPRKRISPDALEGIRNLHSKFPEQFTTTVLADQFKISPEAIRRILKSKWAPSEEQAQDRRARWDRRGEKIWTGMSELGLKPPKKWREMGVGRGDVRKGKSLSAKPKTRTSIISSSRSEAVDTSWSPTEQNPWTQDEQLVIAQETLGERIR